MTSPYTPANTLKFATICNTNNHNGQTAKRFAKEWRQVRWDQEHAEQYLNALRRVTDLKSDLSPTSTPQKLTLELAEFHMQISKYARSATAMEGSRVARLLFNAALALDPSSTRDDFEAISSRFREKSFLKEYKGTRRLPMFMNSLRVEFGKLVTHRLGPGDRVEEPILLDVGEGGVYYGEGYWRYPVGYGQARREDLVGSVYSSSLVDSRDSRSSLGGS